MVKSAYEPVFVTWRDLEYFYSTQDGMLVHHMVTPSINLARTHLYTRAGLFKARLS